MNYLAHLLLAEKYPESQIGNLLGDFVKGSLEEYQNIYSESILKGIRTHRQVDSFTDQHRVYIRSKRRISNNQRHFSGIIIDVCYDHFLANHWDKFCQETLEDFVDQVYDILKENQKILPERLQTILPIIVSEDWLCSYKNAEALSLTFKRLSSRFKRENKLDTAQDEFLSNYSELESDFLIFFPELVSYVNKNRQDF